MDKAPNIACAIALLILGSEVAIYSNLMPITLLFCSGDVNLKLITLQLSLLAADHGKL